MDKFSYISNAHPNVIEGLYNDFKKNPASVDDEWKKFFEGFDFAIAANAPVKPYSANGKSVEEKKSISELSDSDVAKELKVYQLISAYRAKGHLRARTNPVRKRKDRHANLDIEFFGLSENDLEQNFSAGNILGLGKTSLRKIIVLLKKVYCGTIGAEFIYLNDDEQYDWLLGKMEKNFAQLSFPAEKKKHILQKLNDAVVFEKFLHTKYIGQKRFSLEGGETTIPALDAIINSAANSGVQEVVLGMAHRGRLNILANTLGKTYEQIFNEFEGNSVPDTTMGDGDVKYHLGYAAQVKTSDGKEVMLKLSPNPSHLEAVNPVVEGFTRAKADLLYEGNYNRILPILIHGDSAVAGQGVVYEVLQMSQLEGYLTGGTIHFVINNQIGFTTDFDDARSADYCTSLAAMAEAPVLHVNGDDPEAVVFASELATEWRQKFHRDIFIDMVCYRRHGHNEGDDPKFTQPGLYKLIGEHANPREVYLAELISHGDIDEALAKEMDKNFWQQLQDRLDFVKQHPLPYKHQESELAWKKLRRTNAHEDFEASPVTAVSKELADRVLKGLMTYPENFNPLNKIETMLSQRRKNYFDEGKIDWGMAELLAYGTLLLDGNNVRMSGQDVKRGTFSHRHSVIYDEDNNNEYNRLDHLEKEQRGRFLIYNSLLSEFAVLGFEYGYSLASPNSLTIWEAQFGDFANGAQTIIDQFITAGESKWQRMSGVTLLLPHGYEGQGPEHSSARLERFLQSCAEFNITVANVTSPANFFHLLRRQIARPFRKPLVVMSPKSLLRHPRCVSHVDEITNGGFKELIDDATVTDATKVKKIVVCSGKIYYDLLERKISHKKNDVAIIRIEQLYPFPEKQLDALKKKYLTANFIWVQEEPANMGAWQFIQTNYSKFKWGMISRKASASPATGFQKIHNQEQEEIIAKAME